MVIASKTGWTEHFIRHELPLSRGYAYYHAARVLDGERCRWPGVKSAASQWVDSMKQWVRKLVTSHRPTVNRTEQAMPGVSSPLTNDR